MDNILVNKLRDLPRMRVEGRAEFWAWVRRLAKNQVVDFWCSAVPVRYTCWPTA